MAIIFFAFYISFKYIIRPLFLNDSLNDLELGRFIYDQDLESHEEEILDELPSNMENEVARMQFIDWLLPSVKYGEEMKSKHEDCAICLDDYKDGDLCRIFPLCKHIFHPNCIDVWLEKNLTCPICRQYIFGI
ncbi:putative RING-H2 finger protein ATL19 [Hevea brasiliensis]|uniref:putative RING-H2 finger protein ATL19 n=1 Tax=Hevea brasiliensis TaxID=3981 RepID=UPI0025CC59AF|nr:putative RING-H2 finger protein ATL19 [Hevea brasiliensis]